MSSPSFGQPVEERPAARTSGNLGNQTASQLLGDAIAQVQRVIVGQEHMVEQLMVALLAQGHCLLEGVPGVAKRSQYAVLPPSLVVSSPDPVHSRPGSIRHHRDPYLPGQPGELRRRARADFRELLADEINRAPAKVQAAMLEAMAEAGLHWRHDLPGAAAFHRDRHSEPVGIRGCYPLPEAQRDRFLLKVDVPYPAGNEEFEILRRMSVDPPTSQPVLNPQMILQLQRQAQDVFVHNLVAEYIVRLVLATRTPAEFNLPDLTPVIQIGCSPRATLGLVAAARALALIHGRDYVLPTDVQSVAKDVMAHRIVLGFDAVADNIAPAQVIERIVAMVPPPTPVWNQQSGPNHQTPPGRSVPSATPTRALGALSAAGAEYA